jgi:hypothetical protein
MDDALLVRGFERLGDLRAMAALRRRESALRDPVASVGPSTSSITSACVPPIVPGRRSRDVWMIQRRQDFGFTLKPSQSLGIGGDRLRQDLDRDRRFRFVSSHDTPRPFRPRRSGR